jgi:hypothetical protein
MPRFQRCRRLLLAEAVRYEPQLVPVVSPPHVPSCLGGNPVIDLLDEMARVNTLDDVIRLLRVGSHEQGERPIGKARWSRGFASPLVMMMGRSEVRSVCLMFLNVTTLQRIWFKGPPIRGLSIMVCIAMALARPAGCPVFAMYSS